MSDGRPLIFGSIFLGILGLGHAVLTWPIQATIVFFAGGAAIAFLGEAIVIHLGWLEHHIGPTLLGVPLYVLPAWTGVVYIAFRVALLRTSGVIAVLLAAGMATAYDVLTDHQGVDRGHWTYSDAGPGPRHGEVPLWNYAGWIVISSLTAGLALPFL
jgi:hypothetical protein